MKTLLQTCSLVIALFFMLAMTTDTREMSFAGSDETQALDQAESASAQAGLKKFTFSGVEIVEGVFIEIEASSKIYRRGKAQYTTCSYFSEGYSEFLGSHESSENLGSLDADVVKDFCIEHFGDE